MDLTAGFGQRNRAGWLAVGGPGRGVSANGDEGGPRGEFRRETGGRQGARRYKSPGEGISGLRSVNCMAGERLPVRLTWWGKRLRVRS